ncbi:flagellar biosynthetic protein FliO [Clostridium sp.]|jgi:flagellar protein FliO/FliZ|uniref:flagellar biosynthetic protein FliO n=1 Tax=Clostridium sp. TaxID=1506 RepID=UPI003A5C04F2
MSLQFIWMIFRTILALFFVVLLIYISTKLGGTKLRDFQKGKFVSVLERTQLSKENSLLVVRIGEKAYVVSSSSGNIEIIYELTKEEMSKLQYKSNMPKYKDLKDFYKKTGVEGIIKNLRIKKEDKNEK